jgi:hypothetical protein
MITIIDNFLDNPHKLNIEAKNNSKIESLRIHQKNYPGIKVFTNQLTKKFIDTKIRNLSFITTSCTCSEMQYQFVNKTFITGIPHEDLPQSFTFLIFLHPNPEKNSGIELYKKFNEFPSTRIINPNYLNKMTYRKEKFFSSKNKSFFERLNYKRTVREVQKELKKYCSPLVVNNVFNRLVIFDSSIIHRPQNYFGNNESDCRLNLVGFYK